jgi:hypothetical protein
MTKTVPEFWMVWNPAHGNPTCKHPTFEQAREEARRLSHRHPGNDFFVLRCVAGFHMPAPGPEAIEIQELVSW